jgi:hypothetical protein
VEFIMIHKRTFYTFSLTMLGLILSTACLWPAGSATPELAGAVTQTWEALSAFSQQDADESPEPVDESQGDEEPAPTITSTPGPPIIRVSVDTNCRSGPGLIYEYLGALMTYDEAVVLARSSLPGFWVIENPDNLGTECWVGEQYASIQGDTSGLPVRTPPPTSTPEEPDTTPGSIAGFVYFDGNNNGHFGDPQDFPIPNAIISLLAGDCPGGQFIDSGHTDSSGGYIIPNLPPGLYCVASYNPTFLPAYYDIDLEPGQHVVGVNFRDIQ